MKYFSEPFLFFFCQINYSFTCNARTIYEKMNWLLETWLLCANVFALKVNLNYQKKKIEI